MPTSTPAPPAVGSAVERKPTLSTHDDSIHLRLPSLLRNSRPLTLLRKSFSWRPRRSCSLRNLSPSDDARMVAFWRHHIADRSSAAEELALETAVAHELKAVRYGASIRDASQALHHRLVHVLQAYAEALQRAQHPAGVYLNRSEFQCFASVFTVLRGCQVVFFNVSWDDQRGVWQSLNDIRNMHACSSASVAISSGALTIANPSTRQSSSSSDASHAASNTPSGKAEASVQQDDMVVLSLPARLADAASEPLEMQKITFDWEPEEHRFSHLRDFSAIDNAALVMYWKTHREEFLDKPELFFERSAVDALCARRRFHSLRDASFVLHHNLVSLLNIYSSVLHQARRQVDLVLEPKAFTQFCSVYTALCGRDVEFKNVVWNKKKKSWEGCQPDSETSVIESASAGTRSRDCTGSAIGILPPRKRPCSSNETHCKTAAVVSNKDDDGDGAEPLTKVEAFGDRNKRRRLAKNGAKERSANRRPNGDDISGAAGNSYQESITKLKQEVRHGEGKERLAKMEREKTSHIREEKRLDSKAKHKARVELLRELRESAVALHSAGMPAQAETVMERFFALLDEN